MFSPPYSSWKIVFALLVVARAAYPFLNSPLAHMSGLSGRQWKQAGTLLEPLYMGGIDSFLYQPYLAALRWITLDTPWAVHLLTGLLCAALPLCWYLCARELLPRGHALAAGIIIAICPSFLTIYAYFASETLLLPLMGLACAFTARAWKSGQNHHLLLAGLLWVLAAYTRHLALPAMLVSCGLLWWRCRFALAPALAILALFVGLGAVSALHSYRAIGVYAPFGMPEMNAIYARSNTLKIYYHFAGEAKPNWFRSPSFYDRPLAPLSDWRMRPQQARALVAIDPSKGRADWGAALDAAPRSLDWWLQQISYNTVTLLFGSSWPEYWNPVWYMDTQTIAWESALNHALRWVWAPLILLVWVGAAGDRASPLQRSFMVLTLSLICVLLFQTSGIMEGRYRKPVEPMLIVSALILLAQRKERSS